MLIHLMLVILCSLAVVNHSWELTDYSRSTQIAFFRKFLDDGIGVDDFFYDRNKALYGIDEIMSKVQTATDFYHSLTPMKHDRGVTNEAQSLISN